MEVVLKVAEVVVKILELEGISDAFGIPGAGINPVYKFLGLSEQIKHYVVRHEAAAVHAADAYFRASGRMAAALCTSGPGATNFVTGIYTANIDSTPLVAITGQGASAQLGKDAFQCVDIAAICKPIAKATWCVTRAEDLPGILQEAFHTARAGKPGPVLVDLPLDIQNADILFDPEKYRPLPVIKPGPNARDIKMAVDLLLRAKNPIIIMGGGVILAQAEAACIQLAETIHAPIITTYMAKGGVPVDHPLNVNHAGIQVGTPLGNHYLLGSDVVLGIGCRFTDRHTGDVKVYAGERRFIHVDIEPRQINKIISCEIGIVADARLAIEALQQEIASRKVDFPVSDRVKAIPAQRAELRRKDLFTEVPIKPQRVYRELNLGFDEDTMFTTGCGISQIWSGQFQNINKPRKYLPSGGAGTLGFDIPAAFGAMIAKPEHKAVAVMGDFGFTFMVEELAVAAAYHVPLIVVIVNNAYLGLIRQNQKYAYGFEYAVAMPENQNLMDYVKVAEGFGCSGERVFLPEAIPLAIARARAAKKPYVIDIVCDPSTDCAMGGSIAAVKEFD
ncbi:MAG: thiamine pyrophosphate-binding protein [Holophaga sp.]|nr:thiamine pyrophosphate-binding protein [Holophaga sp.]